MEYYLGIIRYKIFVPIQLTLSTPIGSNTRKQIQRELVQLVHASNKEQAKKALTEYWEKDKGHDKAFLLDEIRINDTIYGF